MKIRMSTFVLFVVLMIFFCSFGNLAATECSHPSLPEALDALERFDPRKCRVVELRFFAGLNIEETAEVLQISPNTVGRDWTMAKAWLFRELADRSE